MSAGSPPLVQTRAGAATHTVWRPRNRRRHRCTHRETDGDGRRRAETGSVCARAWFGLPGSNPTARVRQRRASPCAGPKPPSSTWPWIVVIIIHGNNQSQASFQVIPSAMQSSVCCVAVVVAAATACLLAHPVHPLRARAWAALRGRGCDWRYVAVVCTETNRRRRIPTQRLGQGSPATQVRVRGPKRQKVGE